MAVFKIETFEFEVSIVVLIGEFTIRIVFSPNEFSILS